MRAHLSCLNNQMNQNNIHYISIFYGSFGYTLMNQQNHYTQIQMRIARVYLRVSTDSQNLERQQKLIDDIKAQGFYIAGVYSEKASGTIENRPELQKLINDLQNNDFVVAEKIDRICRLPLEQAEKLIQKIKEKGAKLYIPDVIDFSDIIENTNNEIGKIVLDSVQNIILKIALQMSYEDWLIRRKRQKEGIEFAKTQNKFKGRLPNLELHKKILDLRENKFTIQKIATLLNTSISTVKRVISKNNI